MSSQLLRLIHPVTNAHNKIQFMICILLSAFVSFCINCKNMHSMSNIKLPPPLLLLVVMVVVVVLVLVLVLLVVVVVVVIIVIVVVAVAAAAGRWW